MPPQGRGGQVRGGVLARSLFRMDIVMKFIGSYFSFDGELERMPFFCRYLCGRVVHYALCFAVAFFLAAQGWDEHAVQLFTTMVAAPLALALFTGIYIQRLRNIGSAKSVWQFWAVELLAVFCSLRDAGGGASLMIGAWAWVFTGVCLLWPPRKR